MAIDLVQIGGRIRRVREEIFEEKRKQFAKRCDLTERNLAKIEKGETEIKISNLYKILYTTGIDANYILLGKGDYENFQVEKNLQNIIKTTNKEELEMYYKCITTMRSYMIKKEDKE